MLKGLRLGLWLTWLKLAVVLGLIVVRLRRAPRWKVGQNSDQEGAEGWTPIAT